MIRRALISVYDKRGLDRFASGLAELGAELVASGGTAAFLAEHGLEVTRVEELTELPELLGGRVKTLHPRIHAGILARRDRSDDLAALAEHEIGLFDLVCVNLYPFAETAASPSAGEAETIEMIDVGGPALLRAAAKNHRHVVPVPSAGRYADVLAQLRTDGEVAPEARRQLAAEAFAATAAYDAAVAEWLSAENRFPQHLVVALEKVADLRYGENPHQRAAYYAQAGEHEHLLAGVEQVHGRELSLVNLLDLSTARDIVEDLSGPACAIVKHANPCGVAVGASPGEAYERALACDPLSAFGMACVLDRPVDAALGERLAERFVDVLLAPAIDERALEALRRKPGTRVLVAQKPRGRSFGKLDFKRVSGGFLVQDRDELTESRESMQVVCGSLSESAWDDLLFAWRVCRHATSNAIVIAKDGATLGIGTGQVSRVDAVRIALDKARAHGHDVSGAVLASDAFFPFADGPELALAAGVGAIVQPGGSKRDAEVTRLVERGEAALVLTGVRHFRH